MRDDQQVIALLDLDETLVDRSAGFTAWVAEFVDSWALDDGAVRWLHNLDRTTKARDQFFAAVQQRFPNTGSADGAWRNYRARMPELSPPFDGVITQLSVLRSAGWKLVIVTNGRVDNQVGKLKSSGIAELVHGWCVSEEVGARKPDPLIFDAAVKRAGGSGPNGCWVVGDDPTADIRGGSDYGMRTMWISHGRTWKLESLRPDHTAETSKAGLAYLSTIDNGR